MIVVIAGFASKSLFVAATVNGSPISRLAVIQKLEKMSGKKLLDSMIDEKLITDAAAAKNISVTDADVNDEMKKIETSLSSQGQTLDEALSSQGMTSDDLKTQIVLQKEIEKLVADKIVVTDEEVAQYITDNKITVPKGQEAATAEKIKSDLTAQKAETAAQTLVTDLRTKAKIQYIVKY